VRRAGKGVHGWIQASVVYDLLVARWRECDEWRAGPSTGARAATWSKELELVRCAPRFAYDNDALTVESVEARTRCRVVTCNAPEAQASILRPKPQSQRFMLCLRGVIGAKDEMQMKEERRRGAQGECVSNILPESSEGSAGGDGVTILINRLPSFRDTPEPSFVIRVTAIADTQLDLQPPHADDLVVEDARDDHHAPVVAHPCNAAELAALVHDPVTQPRSDFGHTVKHHRWDRNSRSAERHEAIEDRASGTRHDVVRPVRQQTLRRGNAPQLVALTHPVTQVARRPEDGATEPAPSKRNERFKVVQRFHVRDALKQRAEDNDEIVETGERLERRQLLKACKFGQRQHLEAGQTIEGRQPANRRMTAEVHERQQAHAAEHVVGERRQPAKLIGLNVSEQQVVAELERDGVHRGRLHVQIFKL
jgi:hypothetical protein